MIKSESLITIVVPVYNVEKYLFRCVNSILNQTYKKLQIILVDDGSTDSSGKLCDSFKSDKRVSVIHKINNGLSSARNAALPLVRGEYVTFIDSDDWVDKNFIEILYKNLVKANADISVVGYYISPEQGKEHSYFGKDVNVEVMDSKQALGTFLLHDGLGVTVWGKLYKTILWKNIRCPEGKLHEDQYTTYKLLDLANKIVFDKVPLYHYYQRSTSIGHSSFSIRSYDLYDGIHEEYSFIINKYPDIKENAKLERDIWELVFVNMMLRANINNKKIIKKVHQHISSDSNIIFSSNHLSRIRKIQMWLFTHTFYIYKFVYKNIKNRKTL